MPYVVDVTGRGASTATLARRGVVAFIAVAAAVALLLMQYRGVFRDIFPATALVTDVGDGVGVGADVKLRGMLVGAVAGVRVEPRSLDASGIPKHAVDLELKPELAAGIPAGVTARVVPTNIFGAPSLELLDPASGDTRPLARGGVILGDESQQTLQLQTVMNRLNKVLRAVHPAQLNIALTNISQALNGRGERIGSIITRLDKYVTTLNGHTEDFTADLRLLGSGLEGIAEASPELLDTVDNAVVTTRTIVDERDQLAATLTGGADTAGTIDGFLSDNTDRIIRLTHDGAGIAGTLAPQRDLIPRSLASLAQGTTAVGTGLSRTGALSLVFSLTPMRPYTAADCPRYPGVNGPNCGAPVGLEGPKIPDGPLAQGLAKLFPKVFSPELPGPGANGRDANSPDENSPGENSPGENSPGENSPGGNRAHGSDQAPKPPGADKFSLPGLFPQARPSSFGDDPEPAQGGGAGPVGRPAEARTISALPGGPNAGAAGALLPGPLVCAATVVVTA